MCGKMIYLAAVVLVLGLISNVSAELVGYWNFDEGSGTTVADSSGSGNNGTFVGSPLWVAGRSGTALEFDGDDWVDCGDILEITDTISIACWVNPAGLIGDNGWVARWHVYAFKSSESFLRFTTPGILDYTATNATLVIGQWQHVAVTFVPNQTGGAIFYLDGVEAQRMDSTAMNAGGGPFGIGNNRWSQFYEGMIDDVRVYNHILTEPEIRAAMEGGKGYPHALGPIPRDGALHEDTWVNLSWWPGIFAVSHDVYLGDNFNDVNDATNESDTFQGNQSDTFFAVGFPGFPYPDGLVPGKTYYWRVDEINEQEPNSPWKGDVWSFTIPLRTAYNPIPADGAKFVDPDVALSWDTGYGAKLHYVYFGDNFDDVNNASGGLPEGSTIFSPSALENEKTYYWRVDEFDAATTHKGEVWSFTTLPEIPITDPSLVGWWTLDEGIGTTAVDWSGRGNHGVFVGDPQWVPGYDGSALEFDGDDYVDTGNTENLANWTVTAWVISPEAPSGASSSGPVHHGKNYEFNWNTWPQDIDRRGAAAMRVGGRWHAAKFGPLQANTWYHLAATYDGSVLKAYRDGVLITSNPAPSGPPDVESGTLKLGRHSIASQFFTGTVDNVRVYDKALTVDEILLTMRGNPMLAWDPNPFNWAVDVEQTPILSWLPGDYATSHQVYFGTDQEAVRNANTDSPEYKVSLDLGSETYDPGMLEWDTTYYWRIDEYNTDGTISKGNVWSFTTRRP